MISQNFIILGFEIENCHKVTSLLSVTPDGYVLFTAQNKDLYNFFKYMFVLHYLLFVRFRDEFNNRILCLFTKYA